jgi:hypothetical protein
MGAEFCTMVIDGQDKTKTKKEFSDEQRRDLHENGHSYSGGFGMARGLEFKNLSFPNYDDAVSYLESHCEKWESALVVSFKNKMGKMSYLIGAWCSC